MPLAGFRGLPGDTSHQISSRPSASIAARLIRRCPRCAGLKEPPSSPMRFMTQSASIRRAAAPQKGWGKPMNEIEAIGDAVTGGMLGRAVEPNAGEPGADGHTHETNCLNCGAPLAGAYCHACGQKAHLRRSLRGFLLDMVQGLFNFEGKIWRTLPLLAWRPGELTRRYIAGERARFVSPVALYLFTVFLTFAVLNFSGALGSTSPKELNSKLNTAVSAERDT